MRAYLAGAWCPVGLFLRPLDAALCLRHAVVKGCHPSVPVERLVAQGALEDRALSPWIQWVEPEQATGVVDEVYQAWLTANPQRQEVPEILKCFSLNPELLKSVVEFSYSLQFSDGHLTRRLKEMIATLVSALNQCHY